ncbi:glycosyltransferase [Lactiplantibacillus plantarum]|uniref:glycosyltransferase family 2 protein n=1 Tax=Lactiplantibacillus plantarum TaxID=1590 RepID=UPI001E2A9E81|nr:glycosyltransferase [Lactiplantibacillus plantarum]MCC6117789.1 glycosyltransferase [Lactiplantibacillus plantarum]MCW6115336.1 glycosyltransferase [Lactiplantibacillus plantarum]
MECFEKMSPLISIIVRTYNESKHLPELLKSLSDQSFQNYEVVVVDSESTDQTVNIAKQYGARVVEIHKTDFNYSYASNVGIESARGKIICFLSGHSVPANNNYLQKIADLFSDEKVGGCYGDVIPLKDGSLTEFVFDYLGILKGKMKRQNRIVVETEIHAGILSCSNAAVRAKVFESHKFVNALGRGGEDVEMANYILHHTEYSLVRSPELLVKHSHGSNFRKFIREYRGWQSMYEDVVSYINSIGE